jgi:hypothetical protein
MSKDLLTLLETTMRRYGSDGRTYTIAFNESGENPYIIVRANGEWLGNFYVIDAPEAITE